MPDLEFVSLMNEKYLLSYGFYITKLEKYKDYFKGWFLCFPVDRRISMSGEGRGRSVSWTK